MAEIIVSTRPVGRPAKIQGPLIAYAVNVAEFSINWQDVNDRSATGDSQNFRVNVFNKPTRVQLVGVDYLGFALSGRGAGKPPPYAPIRDWVETRQNLFDVAGLDALSKERTLNSIAYGIQVNIGKRGWSRQSKKLRPQSLQFALNRIADKHLGDFADNLAELTSEAIFESFDRVENYKKLYNLF